MNKLEMQTKNLANEKFEKLKALFPNAITETIDEDGNIVRAIDKDILTQEISTQVVEGREERYQFTWPDKKKALLAANVPISRTLRPCREESVNFDKTENLYIEGDNLEVLKLLQETYLGKIKMIYIDPPYNTGNNLIYKNDFSISINEYIKKDVENDNYENFLFQNNDTNGRFHTDWLNMIYPRIKLSFNLLSEDGFLVFAMDHNELSNSLKFLDAIFGEQNRLGIVSVVHKPEGRNMERFFATSNEFALFYAKNKNFANFENVIFDDKIKSLYSRKDQKGNYKLSNYVRSGGGDHNLRKNKPHFWYPIYVNSDNLELSMSEKKGFLPIYPISKSGIERTWKTKKDTTAKLIKNNEIIANKNINGEIEICEKYRKGQLIKTHWTDKKYNAINSGTKLLDELMGYKTFDFPKSVYLIEDILKFTTKKDSLILDAFSGSATTAHAVMNVNEEDGGNRKFIMVQLPEETDEKSEAYKAGYKNICEIGKERIRRAGKKIIKDNKDKEGIENLDIGFRVLKSDTSNMKDVYYTPVDTEQSFLDDLTNNIKEDRSPEDLLFQVILDLGISLSSKIQVEEIDEKEIFVVEDGFLLACFDKDISEKTVKTIAEKQPYYAVFRDSSMASDSLSTNFDQIFESLSPQTVRKVL